MVKVVVVVVKAMEGVGTQSDAIKMFCDQFWVPEMPFACGRNEAGGGG